MLLFTQGNITQNMVVTLQEKTTLASPYYLFVFTHLTTKETVSFVLAPADDLSQYPVRNNEYNINVQTLFAGKTLGGWHYKVYEQTSATNTVVTGLNEVERGKMNLIKSTDFAYKKYDGATTFKAYGG